MLVKSPKLRRAPTEVYWGVMPPVEHSVQIYADQSLFIEALEGFASGGLRAGEGIIVIATRIHRGALERRLSVRGFDLEQARKEDRYIAVDAAATLSQFMVNGWPDEALFKQVVTGLVRRARGNGRRVRAFGEMAAILCKQGHNRATVRLENLWNQFIDEEQFRLFCAYPRSGFTQEADESILEICSHHSRVIPE
jgi:MEDS: MEthanogen/methylotroph, DcmR Sensory domain